MDFAESVWHSNPAKNKTNCFTYALDEPKAGWLFPGYLNDCFHAFAKVPVAALKQQLLDDGLIEIKKSEEMNPLTTHIIAATRDDPYIGDFHFLRMDGNYTWSFKQGAQRPSNKDLSGNIITDLEKANLGNYEDIVGYFKIPPQGLASQKRLYL